jgi:hypothetical protein
MHMAGQITSRIAIQQPASKPIPRRRLCILATQELSECNDGVLQEKAGGDSKIAGVIVDGILNNTLQELAVERAHCRS